MLLIEDACHALGAEYRGKRVGGIADMTVFSFHPVKHLTTGEGGMVATNDARLAETLRRFRNHGISSEARAAAGSGAVVLRDGAAGLQLQADRYCLRAGTLATGKAGCESGAAPGNCGAVHGGLPGLSGDHVPAVRDGVNPAWHLYPVRLHLEMLSAGRGEIFRALRAENIGVNVHYIPVHRHPYYRERFRSSPKSSYPVAEDAYERLISLPMFHSMTAQDVEDVIHALRKVVRHHGVSRCEGRSAIDERQRLSIGDAGSQNKLMSRISDWAGYRALVVGCGSIGRRHARNLKSLGVRQSWAFATPTPRR